MADFYRQEHVYVSWEDNTAPGKMAIMCVVCGVITNVEDNSVNGECQKQEAPTHWRNDERKDSRTR